MKLNRNQRASVKLSTIIILVVVTAIISGLTAGIIVYSSYTRNTGVSYSSINNDVALKQFLEVYASVTNDYYEEVNKTEMIEEAIKGMLNYLDDNYTSYMNSEQTSMLSSMLVGEYQGIGVYISDHEVVEVFKDSPAANAGILVGDIITSVNGEDVTNIDASEFVKLIKNGNNKVVTIGLMRNNEYKEFKISISKLYVPAITYKVVDNTKIGYLRLATFSATLEEQVKDALDDLNEQGVTSLVVDLRENSGGLLGAAESVGSLFTEKGKVLYSLKSKKSYDTFKDKTDAHQEIPIVVLIDENTASAAEILTAILKESYGATLVGKKSFGKGKVQQTIGLMDGSMAKYTTGKWYTPNGDNIDKVGIEPDYEVEIEYIKDSNGNIIDFKDTQLAKAVEILGQVK